MTAGHTAIRHLMVSENAVELFGKDKLFFNISLNRNPSENVATSNVANYILIPVLIFLTAAAKLLKF